jgi:hypothetical protein
MRAEMHEWLQGLNVRYHPMAVNDPRSYCEQVRSLIEANKTETEIEREDVVFMKQTNKRTQR